jgi:hypothetical protein
VSDDDRADWATGVDTHRVIDGRRWRISDPRLPEQLRQRLVDELMAARRAVRDADDDAEERAARDRVHDAKVALGERGLRWWQRDPADAEVVDRTERAARVLGRGGTSGEELVAAVAAITSTSASRVRRVLDLG